MQILLLARKRNVSSYRINDSKGIDANNETFLMGYKRVCADPPILIIVPKEPFCILTVILNFIDLEASSVGYALQVMKISSNLDAVAI